MITIDLGVGKLEKNKDYVHLFKNAMANYPTGVTVVTTFDEEKNPVGLTVNSFASVSLDPLLILWSIDKGVSTYPPFEKTEKFAINILGAEQRDLAYLFASKERERFKHCQWHESEQGLPIIEGAIASLQCRLYKKVEAGDHLTLFGEIIDIDTADEAPLLYHGRKLGPFPEKFHKD